MYKTSLSCLLQIIKSGNLVFVSANLTHKPSSYKWSHAHDLKKVPQGFLSLPCMFRENSFCCLSAQLASLFSGKVNYTELWIWVNQGNNSLILLEWLEKKSKHLTYCFCPLTVN